MSGYQSSADGQLTLLGHTATDPGTVDASASADGQFLYVQTGGNGIVDEFQVNANGIAHRDRIGDRGRRGRRRRHRRLLVIPPD